MSTIISKSKEDSEKLKTFFLSKILERKKLSKAGSSKATYLLKMDLSDFKDDFSEGDAFSIKPVNDSITIDALLKATQLDGKQIIKHPKTGIYLELFQFLRTDANLGKVSSKLLTLLATSQSKIQKQLQQLCKEENKFEKKEYLSSHDVLSILEEASPANMPSQAFVEALLPLLPRFYSCASSSAKQSCSVDFLISTFEHEVQGSPRKGLSSDFLCNRAKPLVDKIEMQLHKNSRFQLPSDPTVPVVMIGPGTGVAPFRAFMQKRVLQNASKNWLFFGERNRLFDFYFENEWDIYQNQNNLKLSLAFSRDQKDKLYVQDTLYDQRKELLKWLNDGAIIYVCGDAKKMEKDVKRTILKIFREELFMSESSAQLHFKDLYTQKRYLTDVY